MSELARYMVPVIALMVVLREGVIVWAMKISAGVGCLAGIAAIAIYRDVSAGFQTLLSVAVGCYLVIYLALMRRSGRRQKKEDCGDL